MSVMSVPSSVIDTIICSVTCGRYTVNAGTAEFLTLGTVVCVVRRDTIGKVAPIEVRVSECE